MKRSPVGIVWLVFVAAAALFHSFPALAALQIQEAEENIPEAGKFIRMVVRSDVGRFSFIPPKGWRSSVDQNRQSIGLQSPEGVAFTITVSTNTALVADGKISSEAAKNALNARFDKPTIKEQYPAYSGGPAGIGFSIDHLSAGRSMSSRAAYLPLKSGALEVALSAPQGKMDALHTTWTGIMNSLRPEK